MENTRAQMLFDSIKTGRKNALVVSPSDEAHRAFRLLVQRANESGDCIINVGYGYFRPRKNSDADRQEFKHYCAQEMHRAQKIINKIHSMQRAQAIDDNQMRIEP